MSLCQMTNVSGLDDFVTELISALKCHILGQILILSSIYGGILFPYPIYGGIGGKRVLLITIARDTLYDNEDCTGGHL